MIDLKTRRLAFHKVLTSVCDNVYYQTPDNFKLKYPCIVYDLKDLPKRNANNYGYFMYTNYSVTVIDKVKDSEITMKLVSLFPSISFDNSIARDGLYHDYLTVNYNLKHGGN